MIPLQLRLSGFLSYRDPVELDFTACDLACISGPNGAGKSSLLDAITWVLFGQARRRDEAIINLQSDAAEVALTFAYEGSIYRVLRTLPRGKNTLLEFQIRQDQRNVGETAAWKPLTERTLRETQSRIESILRLDYETFVNAAFFLQGKADQFAQQTAGRRKEVLGSILGLEIWEAYRERAAARRKALESEVESIDGRVAEIENELAEEQSRKARLAALEAELKRLAATRKSQEAALEGIKQTAASLENQRKLVATLAAALERSRANLSTLEARLADREAERAAHADLLARADEIQAGYQAWQSARDRLARLDEIAARFLEHQSRRQPLLEEIAAQRARLEQERETLRETGLSLSHPALISGRQTELETARKALQQAEAQAAARETLVAEIQSTRQRQAGLRAENEALKASMSPLDERIKKLESAAGAACPLCGQSLTPEHRAATIEQLKREGKELGDRYRANQAAMRELEGQIVEQEARLASLASAESDRLRRSNAVAGLSERLEALQRQADEWARGGGKRLKAVLKLLESGKYAAAAQKQLAKVDRELAALGYDAAAHDQARRAEARARNAEEQYQRLVTARGILQQLDDEIANLRAQIVNLESEVVGQQSQYAEAAATLTAAEAQAPDLEAAERALFDLQEQENRLRDELGAARQKVAVLADLRQRQGGYAAQREQLRRAISQHKTLERAFGKDGVPALLIEQALPQIEARANELLDRLSDGRMSVRFLTQAEYKDKKRDDLRETLDILISDGAGAREYEMYSGGEAFRINFAIRLALSEMLARRKGARLQTLVIDEGFGSQDSQGRQRLIEAINLVKGDFASILVITHLDELKDMFPTRIEVEKTERGSTVRVI